MAIEAPLATVAASECLLGKRVRWNGDHNGGDWPRRVVQSFFRLVGICPEVGIGLGVPRRPIQLVGLPDAPRAVTVGDASRDHTATLKTFAQDQERLASVHGYIFADRSPSCGMTGVKVFAADGTFARVGRGVYAAAVLDAHPQLPAVDAGKLNDPAALFDFVMAVARRAGHANTPQLRERASACIEPARAHGGKANDS